MASLPSVGSLEMEILRFVVENGTLSVREVATYFEKEKGLARTTILTVMERLRKKRLLSRVKQDGVFKYTGQVRSENLLHEKISEFVDRTLGGSVSPLLNYFMKSSELTDEDVEHLKRMVAKLGAGDSHGKN